MVQTDISQLTAECSDWRQILRNYREEFHGYEKALQDTCKKTLHRDHLQDVEHFQNQFDIQLKNIHDLKQHVKTHEKKVQIELAASDQLQERTHSEHESLLNDFLHLENTLQGLRNEFNGFISKVSC